MRDKLRLLWTGAAIGLVGGIMGAVAQRFLSRGGVAGDRPSGRSGVTRAIPDSQEGERLDPGTDARDDTGHGGTRPQDSGGSLRVVRQEPTGASLLRRISSAQARAIRPEEYRSKPEAAGPPRDEWEDLKRWIHAIEPTRDFDSMDRDEAR
jgi:hypothetical protein